MTTKKPQNWPQKLKHFYNKAMLKCTNSEQRIEMQNKLKEIIQNHSDQIWVVEWDKFQIPLVSQKKTKKRKKKKKKKKQKTQTQTQTQTKTKTSNRKKTKNKKKKKKEMNFGKEEEQKSVPIQNNVGNQIEKGSNSHKKLEKQYPNTFQVVGYNAKSLQLSLPTRPKIFETLHENKKRVFQPENEQDILTQIGDLELNFALKKVRTAQTQPKVTNKSSSILKCKINQPNSKLIDRAKRFQQKQQEISNSSNKLYLRNPETNVVIGTSNNIEKQYLRLTSEVNSLNVRTLKALKGAFANVVEKWNLHRNYDYCCEQLKSIRQDLTVQVIRNNFTIKVYECHARLALINDDLGEYNQCQSQLLELYKLGLKGNVNEFIAYKILYFIIIQNSIDINKLLTELTSKELLDEAIKHAIAVYNSIFSSNYNLFFKLYKIVPNLGIYLINHLIHKQRLSAIQKMITA
ncbi:leukocyte receptor cluster member 8 [Anaeramoeba flamelloides]|uniref:Leukocyte receptor cluster member 8 n=1 Tax=Anaeramoeba flamelloides TaxID=1746091 RepID=A0ABQ8Y8J9_9EUKA|nr:leukocyte receptor cluster member 8 [Anaeramoeba flamelloides]